MTTVIDVAMAISVLILAILLDLILGDPSPNNPEKYAFKMHPTVLMGKFVKVVPIDYRKALEKMRAAEQRDTETTPATEEVFYG